LPDGVQSIEINSDSIMITTQVSSGINKRDYPSNVPLQGAISNTEGIKKLTFEARQNYVEIS
jgi:hypothetical protein